VQLEPNAPGAVQEVGHRSLAPTTGKSLTPQAAEPAASADERVATLLSEMTALVERLRNEAQPSWSEWVEGDRLRPDPPHFREAFSDTTPRFRSPQLPNAPSFSVTSCPFAREAGARNPWNLHGRA